MKDLLPNKAIRLTMSMQVLSFATQITDFPGLTNPEFLQALSWERSAGAELRKAAAEGNVNKFSRLLQAKLKELDASTAIGGQCGERVLWSLHAYAEEAGLTRLVQRTLDLIAKKPTAGSHRPVNKPAVNWSQRVSQLVAELTQSVCSEETRPFALLTSIELLANSGHRLSSDQFFQLWRATVSELMMWTTVIHDDPTMSPDHLLVEHGEIPYVGGLLFRDIASSATLIKAGRKVLLGELNARVDGDGTAHADILARLPLWLAPLVRATVMAARFGEQLWNAEDRLLLSNVIDRAVLLCRPDGRAALTNGERLDLLPVLTAASELLDLGLVTSTTDYLTAVNRAVSGKPPKKSRPGVSTVPSSQSDWAKFALLRSDMSVEADSVAITHHLPLPQLDVMAMGRPLIHGDWKLRLKVAGAPIELADEWGCVCWQSDPDADYMELQMTGPGKMRVERIVMLSRKERFLVIADSVSGVPASNGESSKSNAVDKKSGPRTRIEFESRLALCEGLVGTADGTTREGLISGKRLKARVFPLGIAQDKVHSTPHELSFDNNELVLKQVAEGDAMFAPLVLVWHPDRTRVEATWKMLTVTEAGKVVGPDVAVGYRLKLGKFQLLITRSLKKTGNARAVLGHHTRNETVIGTFDKNGDVEVIASVE